MSKLVGTVLQDTDGQFIGLTVAEDIAFALENDCVPQEELFPRVDEVAETVDVEIPSGSCAHGAVRRTEAEGFHGGRDDRRCGYPSV